MWGLIPVVREKRLNRKELAYYYLLNTRLNKKIFENILGKSVCSFSKGLYVAKLLVYIEESGDGFILTRKGYYAVSCAMLSLFSILNTLREEMRSKQI